MKKIILLLSLVTSTFAADEFYCFESSHSPLRGKVQKSMSIYRSENDPSVFLMKIMTADEEKTLLEKEMDIRFRDGKVYFHHLSGKKNTLVIHTDQPYQNDMYRAQLYGRNSLESSYWDCYEYDELD